jgi:hypothetical protein
MGTPRASASVDQMSNEQESASGAGECAGACASRKRLARRGASNVAGTTSCKTGAIITTDGCAAVAVAVGFTGFSWGRTHDFSFAQQSAEQSIARTGMVMLHVCAEAAKGAEKSARNTNAAMVPCFVTTVLLAEKGPSSNGQPSTYRTIDCDEKPAELVSLCGVGSTRWIQLHFCRLLLLQPALHQSNFFSLVGDDLLRQLAHLRVLAV